MGNATHRADRPAERGLRDCGGFSCAFYSSATVKNSVMNDPRAVAAGPGENDPVEDIDLLRRYADTGAEDAFAELVRRRIDLVYSVALRQSAGNRHRAEDATQAVFTDLARKARALAARPVLVGWLYRSAQFAAAGLVRAEQRRQARELEAHTMETLHNE